MSKIAIFSPYTDFYRITDITIEDFNKMGVKGLLLDVDNTLTTHDNHTPLEGVVEWLEFMKKNGVKMMIVSNNHPERVNPFADLLGLNFVAEGKKPLSKGFAEATKIMNLKKNEVVVIGDQIFTDILGANFFGVKSILVTPIEPEKTNFFKFKRMLEKPFIAFYKKFKKKRRI